MTHHCLVQDLKEINPDEDDEDMLVRFWRIIRFCHVISWYTAELQEALTSSSLSSIRSSPTSSSGRSPCLASSEVKTCGEAPCSAYYKSRLSSVRLREDMVYDGLEVGCVVRKGTSSRTSRLYTSNDIVLPRDPACLKPAMTGPHLFKR